jgi:hypothetical protein
MSVISLDEVKTLLQISGTSKDALIEVLIPEIEQHWINYCNVSFADPWPAGMKITSSKMIGYQMAQMKGAAASVGKQSESQGEYSYTRGTGTSGLYPAEILKDMDLFKVARVHFAQKQQQNQDRRGMTVSQLANDKYYDGVNGVPYEPNL